MGRYAEAIAACDKAIAINPDLAYVWYNKGAALGKLGRHEEAIAACNRVIALTPNAGAWHNKGASLAELGRYEEAIVAFNKVIEINPSSSVSYYNLARAYSLNKDKAKALESLKMGIAKGFNNLKIIEKDPGLDFIRNMPEYRQIVDMLTKRKTS